MKTVRLLPVVIAAAVALLLFKGIGLMANGGYVLTGISIAQAEGAAGGEPGGDATLPLPERTMTDASPTLSDDAPTLPLQGAEGDEHAAGAMEHAEAPPGGEAEVAAADCPPARVEGDAAPAAEAGIDPSIDCSVEEPTDAMPLIKDGAGEFTPLLAGGSENQAAVLERLSERRGTLEAREKQLEMRLALVEAAEQRIDERKAALEALETRINALVDQKQELEEAQLVSVVAMYETMKPNDAAAIFDELDMPVLLRVARAISPRKMAPILAKMQPLKARDLTAGLAVDQSEPTIELAGDDLTGLQQIVGQ